MVNILVIDDESSELKKITKILINSTMDFKILTAISVDMAIKVALQENVDIVVSDWQMPEQSGIDLVKVFKNHPELKEIPIIIVTGIMINDKNLSTALDIGASDFVRKPIVDVELIARIKATLRTHEYFNEKMAAEQKAADLKAENLKQKNEKLSSLLFQFERKNKALMAVKRKVTNLMSEVNSLNIQISDVENIVNKEVNTDEDWTIFKMHMQTVDNEFYKKIKTKFPKLTDYDLRLCTYAKFNLSNLQIADVMNIEQKSVHTAKNRLRKKLGLDSASNLTDFLLNF